MHGAVILQADGAQWYLVGLITTQTPKKYCTAIKKYCTAQQYAKWYLISWSWPGLKAPGWSPLSYQNLCWKCKSVVDCEIENLSFWIFYHLVQTKQLYIIVIGMMLIIYNITCLLFSGWGTADQWYRQMLDPLFPQQPVFLPCLKMPIKDWKIIFMRLSKRWQRSESVRL